MSSEIYVSVAYWVILIIVSTEIEDWTELIRFEADFSETVISQWGVWIAYVLFDFIDFPF